MVSVCVELHDLHRLELLEACFLRYLIFAFIGIVLEVPHIGDVTHIAHLVTKVLQVTIEDIESDGRSSMPQMGVAIDRWPADIHAHMPFVQGSEGLFETSE